MKKSMSFVAIVIFMSFMLFGCAQVQRPVTHNFHLQPQLESVLHWQTIAKSNAIRLVQTLAQNNFIEKGKATPSVYIAEDDTSPFGMAMRGYLITELMATAPGLQLSNDPDAPFVLVWETQLVTRNDTRTKPFMGVPVMVGEWIATVIMGGGWNTYEPFVPHTEMILTTNIILNKQCLARYSDTYFINDSDMGNYWSASGSYVHPRSIAAHDQFWRNKLASQGFLDR